MAAWDVTGLDLRRERMFGDRVVTCRAARPNDLHAMLRAAAARAPQREALICNDQRFTWTELAQIVEETAAGLHRLGVRQGDRVALLIGNRVEFVIALYAIARLGAIAVPMSTREQAPGISYVLEHSGARLLLADEALGARLPETEEGAAQPARLLIDAATGERPLRQLREPGGPPVGPVEVGEEDTAAILYTSGTTGRPKGAMVAHVNLVHAALIYQHTMVLADGERSVVAVPMTHVTGISAMIAPMALVAGTLVIMPEFKAPEFLRLAAAERMTHTVLVPAMYNLLLQRTEFAAYDLSSWRIGGYGGAPMPAPTIEALQRALPSLGLLNLYGSTETVVPQAIMPPACALEHRLDVGLTAPGGEIVVMDTDGREVPRGSPGEIWMRNASVVRGYWNDPKATAENIIGGFWRSGDLGLIDEDGFIRVLDRIKDMINRGGFKIYTAEVESTLAEHPAVLESAVVAKPCPVLGERVHAFVALRPGQALSDGDLKAFCATRLADYKRPETFTLLREPLPRNANGKLLKREMQQQLLAEND